MNTPSTAPSKMQCFKMPVHTIAVPERFTFPFAYTPHELSEIAMKEVQEYLAHQTDFDHPFFYDTSTGEMPIGKMFGVLVVKTASGNLGYLAAFSGKLANSNHISFFVPPVFDMLQQQSFFVKEEKELNAINAEIDLLEKDSTYHAYKENKACFSEQAASEIENKKQLLKNLKKERKLIRINQKTVLPLSDYQAFEENLIRQSLRDKHELNVIKRHWENILKEIENKIKLHEDKIKLLREKRKKRSAVLQQKLFKSYHFLNAKGEVKDLLAIFQSHAYQQPPAGAGECCAPKLLQYAYTHQLQPVCMAEFWWGSSPKSEIRLHKQFYPSCWGKCEPILSHMLQGLMVEQNPLLLNPAEGQQLEIIYEDAYFIVINKPSGFLSVPGIHIKDSVYERIRIKYPNTTGPLIVHRLDMATSGLMVIARTKEIHKQLQNQFIKRIVKKRYTALLDGEVAAQSGTIILPLRVDLDDRPRQLVCYDYGKYAETYYEVQEVKEGRTLVFFYPLTGRTHQLRVHAAHTDGLNCSIVGDDLYGKAGQRLCLHAQQLSFIHPVTQQWMTFETSSDF